MMYWHTKGFGGCVHEIVSDIEQGIYREYIFERGCLFSNTKSGYMVKGIARCT